MIIRTITAGAFATNCCLVFDEASKIGVIIDPGFEAQQILAAVKADNVKVQAILLTHAHCDHLTAAKEVQDTLQVPLWVHKADLAMLEDSCNQASMLGLTMDAAPHADNFYSDGQEINFGPLTFKVLHTPGHTPGGVTLVCGQDAFCGDTIFEGSIGRTDFGGDSRTLFDSIRSKIYMLPDETTLHPGHGPLTSVGHEKRTNPFVRAICPDF